MADATPRKPSEKEAFLFLTILGCMKNKPEVDWDLVAERAGYSNAASVKVRFGQIKKALGFLEDGTIGTPAPTKPRVKKEKTVGSGTNTTPSKVTKKPSTPRKPKTPKVQKGELAGLQSATESFLSGGNGNGGGGVSSGVVAKYEDFDELQNPGYNSYEGYEAQQYGSGDHYYDADEHELSL